MDPAGGVTGAHAAIAAAPARVPETLKNSLRFNFDSFFLAVMALLIIDVATEWVAG